MAIEYRKIDHINKKLEIVLFLILIAAISAFFIYTKMNAPKPNAVDGVYENACCEIITIKHGYISQRGKTLEMKLLNMKFGLTGYVKAQFSKDGMHESEEATAISFSGEKGKRMLTVPIDQQNRIFVENSDKMSKQ